MSHYYIRIPEQDESRGPFDIPKLETLAEAGQINPNTLYYDVEREEWIPIALNDALRSKVFPEREKLTLRIQKEEKREEEEEEEEEEEVSGLDIESMLLAAEGGTEERRKRTRQKKSFEHAAKLSAAGLGIMMIFSALFMILSLMPVLRAAINDGAIAHLFNYPTILIGIFDLILGVLLILSVTEVFPLARGRAMLTLGFGLYVGWALGDPLLMGLTAAAAIGIFLATISQSLSTMIFALVLGIGGNAWLAYLALNGRFDGFFDGITLNLIAN